MQVLQAVHQSRAGGQGTKVLVLDVPPEDNDREYNHTYAAQVQAALQRSLQQSSFPIAEQFWRTRQLSYQQNIPDGFFLCTGVRPPSSL